MRNSDFIIYVDESGDHSLEKPNREYPLFVLSFCIFKKAEYVAHVSPAIQEFKFKHFGHDNVVLHEREIRKQQGQFGFLTDAAKRNQFMGDLNALIKAAPMTIIAAVVDKQKLNEQYIAPDNPYNIALAFCIERTVCFLRAHSQTALRTFLVVEGRGKVENNDLELEFRRIVGDANHHGPIKCLELLFADKRANMGGLQIADLTARPIGIRILRPNQLNRAYEIIEPKFRRGPIGLHRFGLKVFP